MLKFSFSVVIFLLAIYSSEIVAQTTPDLVLPKDLFGSVKFKLSTSPNDYKEKLDYLELAVYIKNTAEEYGSNPIHGQYVREENYLIFKPYYPFESGTNYVVRTKKTQAPSGFFFQSFQIGKQNMVDESKILNIYPSASLLPENLLRFYLCFNTPMKKGQAIKHIQLIDAEGNIDNHAFMEFKHELWSVDGKRLTILFDPGRIKRGVSTNMRRGPALLEGKRYRLTISETWQDVYGQQLSTKTTKEFEVGSAYRRHIKVKDWLVNKPKANSYDTLTVLFDRVIDHALIQSMIKLKGRENNRVLGHWEILEKEQLIQFIPEKKWRNGNYRIEIDSRIEDIAGNNLQNLLDQINTDQEKNNKTHHYIDLKI